MTPRLMWGIIAVVLIAAMGILAGLYSLGVLTRTTSTSPSSYSTTTGGYNSTDNYSCPEGATCDFYVSLQLNVTCTGCQFNGEYTTPTQGSASKQVSGNGTSSYYTGSMDSPLYLSWKISKSTSGGTLEVKVLGAAGQVYYDTTTTAPYGTLEGVWSVAVPG